jgi:hypothetical protein
LGDGKKTEDLKLVDRSTEHNPSLYSGLRFSAPAPELEIGSSGK